MSSDDSNEARRSESDEAREKVVDKRLEIVATILLGCATVLIALAAYQSALWGGIQDTRLTESVQFGNDAIDSYQLGDGMLNYDRLLFVELVVQLEQSSVESDAEFDDFVNDGIGGFILGNMSDGGEAARDWFDNDLETPFEGDEYTEFLYADANDFEEQAATAFTEAKQANKNSDDFVLASTLLAAVLFFAGISTVLTSTVLRIVLLAGGTSVLVGSGLFMFTLNWTDMF